MFKLAIVGRPNVGKSALFNRMCRERIAIVDEAEGTTRDRLYAQVEAWGYSFIAIDTGGIDPSSSDQFADKIKEQAELALKEADSIVLVVDGRVGPTAVDLELARFLLTTEKPITLAVNKIDDPSQEGQIHQFYSLGISKIVAVSATQGYQIAELIELAWQGFHFETKNSATTNEEIKIALIGRTNVGKSTLANALLNEERCMVSPIAGTTRDSVDIPFTYENQSYLLIDTAGIRRKHSEKEVVEKFAFIRTERAIERADVCILLLDTQEGLTTQEKRIAKQIEKAGKGCVVLVNKWDLNEGFRMEHCVKAIREECSFLAHAPLIFISALTGRNLNKILPEIKRVYENGKLRITTHQLNKMIERAIQLNHPPMLGGGRRLRIYYITQVAVKPPRFALFVNHPELMAPTYLQYLINQMRKKFIFSGNPLVLMLRGKNEK